MMLLGNQRGAALLATALIIVIVGLVMDQTLNSKLRIVNSESTRQQRIGLGRQAMRDFALIARRANEDFLANPACPGPYIVDPTGRPFCWPDAGAPADRRCIENPMDPAAAQLCLATELLYTMQPSSIDNSRGMNWLQATLTNILEHFDSNAFAQDIVDAHRPALAGFPTNNITPVIGCAAATPGDTYCKRCTNTNPGDQNLDCVQLRVCIIPGGCTAANQFTTQVIGIMAR